MRVASTRRLASGRLELSSVHRSRIALKIATIGALIAVALAALAHFGVGRAARPAANVEQQNAALRDEVARVRAELEIERSTRSALDAQLRDLSAEAGALRSRLEFVTAQSDRPRDGGR